MTREAMLTELRDLVDESATDAKVREATLLSYLAEGQDKFCEETGYFRDIANYTLTLQTNVAVYAIPARAIQVLDIWDGTRKLGHFEERDRAAVATDWDPAQAVSATGKPNAWQTDRTTGYVTFDKTPTAAENGTVLTLHLWRYSRYALDDDAVPVQPSGTTTAEPEIPNRFHRACIEWAAYKVFMHHDKEIQDPVKASDHLAAFNAYVLAGKVALRRYQNLETRVGTNSAYRT